jgi:hypothetical protein
MGRRSIDEGFEIKVRNHKKEAVEVRVVEHIYRGLTWDISSHSDTFTKTDAQTVEFRVTLNPRSGEDCDVQCALHVVSLSIGQIGGESGRRVLNRFGDFVALTRKVLLGSLKHIAFTRL